MAFSLSKKLENAIWNWFRSNLISDAVYSLFLHSKTVSTKSHRLKVPVCFKNTLCPVPAEDYDYHTCMIKKIRPSTFFKSKQLYIWKSWKGYIHSVQDMISRFTCTNIPVMGSIRINTHMLTFLGCGSF